MKHTLSHTHPCHHCGTELLCNGDLFRNHDGEPAVICGDYHQDGGAVAYLLCDLCTEDDNWVSLCEDVAVSAWPPAWIYTGSSKWTAPTSSDEEGNSGLA